MPKIIHFFTSTKEGNLAYHVGDDKHSVTKNREALSFKYNFDISTLRYMNQVHGNRVQIVTHDSKNLIDECDGLITNEMDLPLMVMVADCIPILFKDESKGVIAAVHAGRNSTFLNISKITAETMIKEFDCKPSDIKVQLGPSIQKCCYEVSSELANIVKKSFGEGFVNHRLIDLQGINKKQLQSLGITNIEISSICTKCSNQPYYSYRKNNHTGRFAGIIMQKNG